MTDELEQRLTRVLENRAASITTVPDYRSVDAPARDSVDGRRKRAPSRATWYLGAAAVAAAITVLVSVFVFVTGRRQPPPADQHAYCMLTQSPAFMSALRSGALPAGTEVLAGATDGRLLVGRQQAGITHAVELIDENGVANTLWTARAGERVQAVANPSGAIGGYWVAFLLRSVDSRAATAMVAARNGAATPLSEGDHGYDLSSTPETAPVVIGDSVNILETSTAQSSDQELLIYWRNPFPWMRTQGGSFTGVIQMLAVGGNLVLPRNAPHGTTDVHFLEPQFRPSGLEPPAAYGYSFSSDRTTLSWLTDRGGEAFLWQWATGQAMPTRRTLPPSITPTSASGGYVAARATAGGASRLVVNSATGAVAQLPAGADLVRVDGAFAVVSYVAPGGGIGYSRIPVTALMTGCR